jgi:hypothetical protein
MAIERLRTQDQYLDSTGSAEALLTIALPTHFPAIIDAIPVLKQCDDVHTFNLFSNAIEHSSLMS